MLSISCLSILYVIHPLYCQQELISLQSEKGANLFLEAKIKNNRLIRFHQKQQNRLTCGPASLANLFNGIGVGYRVKYQNGDFSAKAIKYLTDKKLPITVNEEDILRYLHSKNWKYEYKLNKTGITLLDLTDAIHEFQLESRTVFTYDEKSIPKHIITKLIQAKPSTNTDSTNDVNYFRKEARQSIKSQTKGIIVNFDSDVLGYKLKGGHFSPLGGYNEIEDRFLLLDVQPENPSVWVSTELLWKAMTLKYDNDSNLPRGYLLVYS